MCSLNKWNNVETSVERILEVIDTRINKYYDYNECGISVVAYVYIKKFLAKTPTPMTSQLKILCVTAYFLAMKYLLDSTPTINDYCKIVNVSNNVIIKKELQIGKNFGFNFTPMDIDLETGVLTKI